MSEAKPHPEVVNAQPRVLIVGYGHVGQQMARYFTDARYVDLDGAIRRAIDHVQADREDDLFDIGFLCVPTPERADGSCDTSAVYEAFTRWSVYAPFWCIKSTVEIGTTDALNAMCPKPTVCVSPEYYGETLGHPLAGVQRETFIVLGGPPEVTRVFATAWSLVTNSYTRIYQVDTRTAELCKLMENAWIATKVSFCNQFYDLADLAGVDWHTLREVWLADPRVGRSHTYVYPENRGWGGKCLPKDTANLCHWARAHGRPADLIEAIRAYNRTLRGGKSL